MVTRPEVIEVPQVSYVPVPTALTAPLALPARPVPRCSQNGNSVICVPDALALIPIYQAIIYTCNADRATTALLGKTDGQ